MARVTEFEGAWEDEAGSAAAAEVVACLPFGSPLCKDATVAEALNMDVAG